jgi:hypothetical protein
LVKECPSSQGKTLKKLSFSTLLFFTNSASFNSSILPQATKATTMQQATRQPKTHTRTAEAEAIWNAWSWVSGGERESIQYSLLDAQGQRKGIQSMRFWVSSREGPLDPEDEVLIVQQRMLEDENNFSEEALEWARVFVQNKGQVHRQS